MATVELVWAGYEFGVDGGKGYVRVCESEKEAYDLAYDLNTKGIAAKVVFRTRYTDGWGDVL